MVHGALTFHDPKLTIVYSEELLGRTYKGQASCKVGQGQSILWRHWKNIKFGRISSRRWAADREWWVMQSQSTLLPMFGADMFQ